MDIRESDAPTKMGVGGEIRAGGGARSRAKEILSFLGLENLTGRNAEQFSGGQKQRVAIGRALMNSPDIILADEPTGSLDSQNSATVYELFRRIHDEMKTTLVIVTHDRDIAQQTDRVIEITDGLVTQDVTRDCYKSSFLPSCRYLK